MWIPLISCKCGLKQRMRSFVSVCCRGLCRWRRLSLRPRISQLFWEKLVNKLEKLNKISAQCASDLFSWHFGVNFLCFRTDEREFAGTDRRSTTEVAGWVFASILQFLAFVMAFNYQIRFKIKAVHNFIKRGVVYYT